MGEGEGIGDGFDRVREEMKKEKIEQNQFRDSILLKVDMLTSQVKDLKLGSKVMFKEMSVSGTRTCESQGEVEEE